MRRLIPFLILACGLAWGLPALAAQGECPAGVTEVACLAENGDPEAQYNWGLALLYGEGIPEDRREAMLWLDKAAKQGHRLATNMLTSMSLSNEPGEFCGNSSQ